MSLVYPQPKKTCTLTYTHPYTGNNAGSNDKYCLWTQDQGIQAQALVPEQMFRPLTHGNLETESQ
jgi:hypothetical protein